MDANDLIDALKSNAVLINNLTITINNNTAETVVIGDSATVNRIMAQQQRTPLITGGIDYQYSHCAPLNPAVADFYWQLNSEERARARAEYLESLRSAKA